MIDELDIMELVVKINSLKRKKKSGDVDKVIDEVIDIIRAWYRECKGLS